MLAHAQDLVYRLTELMPTQYQKDNKDSDAGIILAGTGSSRAWTLSNQISKCIEPIFKYQPLVNKGNGSYRSQLLT